MKKSIAAALTRYPESHRTVQIMRLQLGQTELRAGRIREGREILQNVLSSLEKHQGADHPLVGQTLLHLGEADIGNQHFEAADAQLIRSLEIYRALRDKWHPDIEEVLRLRAQAQSGLGNLSAAANLIREADALRDGREKVSLQEAKKSQQVKF